MRVGEGKELRERRKEEDRGIHCSDNFRVHVSKFYTTCVM